MMIIIKDANYKTVTIKGGNSYCLAKKRGSGQVCKRAMAKMCVPFGIFTQIFKEDKIMSVL